VTAEVVQGLVNDVGEDFVFQFFRYHAESQGQEVGCDGVVAVAAVKGIEVAGIIGTSDEV